MVVRPDGHWEKMWVWDGRKRECAIVNFETGDKGTTHTDLSSIVNAAIHHGQLYCCHSQLVASQLIWLAR